MKNPKTRIWEVRIKVMVKTDVGLMIRDISFLNMIDTLFYLYMVCDE